MGGTRRLLVCGTAMSYLLVAGLAGVPARAQTQPIQASNPWARRAAAMTSMGSTGSQSKMGSTGSMGQMSGMENKSGMGQMSGGGTSAVYVTLTNSGSQADALVAASCEAAGTVELHEVTREGSVMKMRPVKSIPVPAGGRVELKPGGYHIMLLSLHHDLKPGDKVPVTLRFEHAGELAVEAVVK